MNKFENLPLLCSIEIRRRKHIDSVFMPSVTDNDKIWIKLRIDKKINARINVKIWKWSTSVLMLSFSKLQIPMGSLIDNVARVIWQ